MAENQHQLHQQQFQNMEVENQQLQQQQLQQHQLQQHQLQQHQLQQHQLQQQQLQQQQLQQQQLQQQHQQSDDINSNFRKINSQLLKCKKPKKIPVIDENFVIPLKASKELVQNMEVSSKKNSQKYETMLMKIESAMIKLQAQHKKMGHCWFREKTIKKRYKAYTM